MAQAHGEYWRKSNRFTCHTNCHVIDVLPTTKSNKAPCRCSQVALVQTILNDTDSRCVVSAGYSSFKMLMFITFPILVAFSRFTTAVVLSKHASSPLATLKAYFWATVVACRGEALGSFPLRSVHSYSGTLPCSGVIHCRLLDAVSLCFLGDIIPLVYFLSLAPLVILCGLSGIMIRVNGFYDGVYNQSNGCTDPMIRISTASGTTHY